MLVNSVSLQYKKYHSGVNKKENLYSSPAMHKTTPDVFVRSTAPIKIQFQSLSFRGKPWYLTLDDRQVENYYSFDFDMARTVYDKMALGNYLDTIQEQWFPVSSSDPNSSTNRSVYERIRRNNLSFLDNIDYNSDKQRFVEYYKQLTGYPNLSDMQDRVKSEAITSAVQASKKCEKLYGGYGSYGVIKLGFNPVCSAGHDAVLPGSDIDGLFIILNGTGDLDKDAVLVEKYKGHLWNCTDQRILSYNHPSAFPVVYTLAQIKKMLDAVNSVTKKMNLDSRENWYDFETRFEKYFEEKSIYDPTDYVSTNSFLIDLIKYFPNNQKQIYFSAYDTYLDDFNNPTREMVKNFAFFAEVYCNAKYWEKGSNVYTRENFASPAFFSNYDDAIMSSVFTELVNPLQISAIRDQNKIKDKIIERRRKYTSDFNNKSIAEQFNDIKRLIKASYSDGIESDTSPHRALLIKLGHVRKND